MQNPGDPNAGLLSFPLGFQYAIGYHPISMPFPAGIAPFAANPLLLGSHPLMALSVPKQEPQAEEKGSSNSPRKQPDGQVGDNMDTDGQEVIGRPHVPESELVNASTASLGIPHSMSFTTAPLPMRSLHSSVTALPMLDALATQGASLEFLQGMTTSMSAAMLQTGSPHQGAADPGYLPPSALQDNFGMPRSKSAATFHPAGGLQHTLLPIAPLTAGTPSTAPDTASAGKAAGRKSIDMPGAKPSDHLAEDAVSQLQAFLNQSQAAGSSRHAAKGEGSSGGSKRAAGGSSSLGRTEAPALRTMQSGGGRRTTGLSSVRSASHLPQLGQSQDGPPTGSRSRGPIAGSTGALNSMARISSLQALVEVAAAECEHDRDTSRAHTSVPDTESADPDDIPEDKAVNMDDSEAKRLKRKQSNRESARRSRLKKQAEADALTRATSELQSENNALRTALTATQGLLNKVVQEKAELIAKLRSLGEPVPVELEWTVPIISIPSAGYKRQHSGV